MTTSPNRPESTISTVIPAYNPGPLLAEAVASVVSQSYHDWDLVVVDDGSTEDLSWVDDIDPRVRLLRSERQGTSGARNLGICSTEGEYVAFLDQDDRWHPNKLQHQLEALSTGVLFSYTGFDLIDETGRRTGPGYGGEVGYLDMLGGKLGVLQSSAVIRRDALERVGMFNPLLVMQQDLDLFLRLSRIGPTAYVDSIEVDYRIHGGNASRNYWRAIRELLSLYDLHELDARANGDRVALDAITLGRRGVRRTYSYQAIDAARRSLHARQYREAVVAICRSVRLSPAVTAHSLKSFVSNQMHDRSSSTGPAPTG